jgi:hypothetical protein
MFRGYDSGAERAMGPSSAALQVRDGLAGSGRRRSGSSARREHDLPRCGLGGEELEQAGGLAADV